MVECVHCEINRMVADYIENGPKPVDLAEIAAMIAQALGEFILASPPQEQANMMAESLSVLGQTFLDKPEDDAERPHKPH